MDLKALLLLLAFTSAPAGDEPLYKSSVVGTDFDFILEKDPDTFVRLEDKGSGAAEMPDKSDRSAKLVQQAFLFVARFNDGTRVNLAIDADFKTQDDARKEALRYTPRLGKLPTALRRGVDRVVVHQGGEDVTAFSDVGLIVLYSENATRRIGTHDLEETVFHESVHAAWDIAHASSAEWLDAQKKDAGFVTDYASENPTGEDLAESALFAYALIHHPKRIPKKEAARIARAIPNRIAFVEKLLPKGKPLHFAVEAKRDEQQRKSTRLPGPSSRNPGGGRARSGAPNSLHGNAGSEPARAHWIAAAQSIRPKPKSSSRPAAPRSRQVFSIASRTS